jgi:hypothetical protein
MKEEIAVRRGCVRVKASQLGQKAGKYSPKTQPMPQYWDSRSPPDAFIVGISEQSEGHWRGRCNTVSFQGKGRVTNNARKNRVRFGEDRIG